MQTIRFYIAMALSKLAAFGLRILGRNASYMPGVIALKVCKDFIGHLKKPPRLICVTGTNGKTTTSNFIASALTNAGYKVTNNSFGSNVAAGVAAALLENSTFTGKSKNDYAVIEVDERSSLRVYPFITPDYIICNNIMRDSVKRNAHTEFISFILNSAIPAETTLVLNADDPICANLAPQCEKRIYFGMDAQKPAPGGPLTAPDVVYCPRCGAPLKAEYLRFQHIGRWACTACDFASPARDFTVTDIDFENETFTVEHECETRKYRLVNDNIVNVFNFCGAIALLKQLGITDEQLDSAFQKAAVVRTRYEQLTAGDLNITMILAKGQNPVAVSRVFSYVAARPEKHKCVLLIIDDKADNIKNSENCAWLWDLDYAPLADPEIDKLIFAGKREKDHLLRAAMTGIDPGKILTTDTVKDSQLLVDLNEYHNVFILYDNYLMDEARREAKMLLQRGGAEA